MFLDGSVNVFFYLLEQYFGCKGKCKLELVTKQVRRTAKRDNTRYLKSNQ